VLPCSAICYQINHEQCRLSLKVAYLQHCFFPSISINIPLRACSGHHLLRGIKAQAHIGFICLLTISSIGLRHQEANDRLADNCSKYTITIPKSTPLDPVSSTSSEFGYFSTQRAEGNTFIFRGELQQHPVSVDLPRLQSVIPHL
jgi:hypothetical protein